MSQEHYITFQELSEEWLIQKRITVKNSTYVKYRNVLAKHILPELGDIPINEIDNRKILKFINTKLDLSGASGRNGLANKTVKDLLLIVNNILKYGKMCYPNAMCPVEIVYPSIPKNEIRILSHEEQRALEEVLYTDMDSIKLGILICLYTGLRIGEICGLRWEDISLFDGTISVKRTVQRLQTFSTDDRPKTQIVIDSPKTSNSLRKLPLPEFLLPIIKGFYPSNGTGFLLTGKSDVCMEPRTLENHFMAYLHQAENFRDETKSNYQPGKLTFHSLRHTFATRCVEAGFEIKCLSEILGHANVNITLNRYVHSSIQMKRDNMKKLQNTYQTLSMAQE